uniref:Uncharacterized protein n=1 Tax=Clostridium botulinum TaxID=1491 RepID=C4IXI6_CLOBO|nr:hypothetical protein [Clostridium botulinum]
MILYIYRIISYFCILSHIFHIFFLRCNSFFISAKTIPHLGHTHSLSSKFFTSLFL